MARADFITSLFLMFLGAGVVAESWRMPRYTEFGTSIWSAPGVVPGMIGASLALMGAALYWRARAVRHTQASVAKDRAAWVNVAIAFCLCFVFAALLVGSVPFVVAAFLFILAFVLLFDLRENPDVLRDYWRLIRRGALVIAVAGTASLAIATIFEDFFFVRLP